MLIEFDAAAAVKEVEHAKEAVDNGQGLTPVPDSEKIDRVRHMNRTVRDLLIELIDIQEVDVSAYLTENTPKKMEEFPFAYGKLTIAGQDEYDLFLSTANGVEFSVKPHKVSDLAELKTKHTGLYTSIEEYAVALAHLVTIPYAEDDHIPGEVESVVNNFIQDQQQEPPKTTAEYAMAI